MFRLVGLSMLVQAIVMLDLSSVFSIKPNQPEAVRDYFVTQDKISALN